MVSMARPFLADPDWVIKAQEERSDEINTCIAAIKPVWTTFLKSTVFLFGQSAACHETEWAIDHSANQKRRRCGCRTRRTGRRDHGCRARPCCHVVRCSIEIGGQFNMAKYPWKEEFHETIRYFNRQIELTGVNLQLNTPVDADMITNADFDEVILATGVHPRRIALDGIDHPKALSYIDVLRGGVEVGERVAIIGAGGIGFDVAEFLSHKGPSTALDRDAFMKEWGVDTRFEIRGGLTTAKHSEPARKSHYANGNLESWAQVWARPPGGFTVRHSSKPASKCWAVAVYTD